MVRMTDLLKKAKRQLSGPARRETPPPFKKEKEPVKLKKAPEIQKPKEPPKEKVKFSELVSGGREEESVENGGAQEFIKASISDKEESKKIYFEASSSLSS